MSNSIALNNTFMNIATEFSKLSQCVSLKVACVAVKDGRIIATGINGTASGYYNCSELFDEHSFNADDHHKFSDTYEIHAEMNMCLFCARRGISLENCAIYCTHMPCWNCLKHLSVVGIKKIYYKYMYQRMKDEDAKVLDYCNRLGIGLQIIL